MSALVALCDRECCFVSLSIFISIVYRDLSGGLTKDVVFKLFVLLSSLLLYLFY